MHGMDGREIEPRVAMWARAEVSWQDASGDRCRASATLENTSHSGACLRVKRPFDIGSRLTVSWYREQFCAVARNCRSDGHEFVLGVRREAGDTAVASEDVHNKTEPEIKKVELKSPAAHPLIKSEKTMPETVASAGPAKLQIPQPSSEVPGARERDAETAPSGNGCHHDPGAEAEEKAVPFARPQLLPRSEGGFPRHERKVMQSKSLFPSLWRRHHNEDAPEPIQSKEIAVNKPNTPAVNSTSGPVADLLSYEDIYHAAGIMSPRSGYGIHKVVEMLNSDRLRDLSKDIKRVSVLMALDAAGTPVSDLLQDATRRQQALNSYEAAKKKQLEDFEAQKSQENAKIEAEIERIRAHYSERIQQNRDLVAQEKEGLRNWQAAMQHEAQRIAEVMELCGAPASADTRAGGSASQVERTGQNAHADPRASAVGAGGK